MFWVGAVLRRRVIRGRKRMGVLRSPVRERGPRWVRERIRRASQPRRFLRTSFVPGFAYTRPIGSRRSCRWDRRASRRRSTRRRVDSETRTSGGWSRSGEWSGSSTSRDPRSRRARAPRALQVARDEGRTMSCWMRAPSSVSRVMRKFELEDAVPRRSVQSPPPGRTFHAAAGPPKWPLAIGAVTRMP